MCAEHDHVGFQLARLLQDDVRDGLSVRFGQHAFHGDAGSAGYAFDLIEGATAIPAQLFVEAVDVVRRDIAAFEIDRHDVSIRGWIGTHGGDDRSIETLNTAPAPATIWPSLFKFDRFGGTYTEA